MTYTDWLKRPESERNAEALMLLCPKAKIHYGDWDTDHSYGEFIPSGKPWKTHAIDAKPVPNFRTDRKRVQAVLKRQRVPSSFSTDIHARRVAWRIVRDWLRAQMAMIEADAVDLAEVFMPYMLTRNGDTAYQLWQRGGLDALPRGEVHNGQG